VSNEFLVEHFADKNGSQPFALTDIHDMSSPEKLCFAVRLTDKKLMYILNEFINEYFIT
jgi:hypothetical protein